MKFPAFLKTITLGAITLFLCGLVVWGWLISHSSLNLLAGGVNRFPTGAVFLPKQTPAMISLLANPEKLNALHQVTLSLANRQRDRLEWQAWEQDLAAKIGFNYQRDWQPWLGNEMTLAITSLDSDRNPLNGLQPGYLLAIENKNRQVATDCLHRFYGDEHDATIESYKGTNIISPTHKSDAFWSGVVVGNFVLFANQAQILREAINQAQAIDLNLEQSDYYQMTLEHIQQPHIGIGYIDVLGLSAWLDKSAISHHVANKSILGIALSIKQSDLAAQTFLFNTPDSADDSITTKSLLDNPEFRQILASLPFDQHNTAYIELQTGKSLLEDQIPLYKVSKLAIQSLFPHLKAIKVQDLGKQNNISRANILFKLD